MQIETLPGKRLSEDHICAWKSIQHRHTAFDSPFFRPEFFQCMSRVRGNVEAGVLKDRGEVVGFFPYERTGNRAVPLANILSDFHGVVASPDLAWSPAHLLEECQLTVWDYHHLIPQKPLAQSHWQVADSPYMDLSQGFEAYRQSRRQAGSKKTKQIERKRRQLERDLGPIRLETDCRDEQVLKRLLAWKSQQYQSHGLIDLFAVPWIVDLLRQLWQHRQPEFHGRLFALFAGNQLVAAEFALQSNRVLHSWFPSFDRDYGKYGVGHILTMEIAKAAEQLKIARIDLGKGEEEYKQSLASGGIPIAEGSLDLNPLRRLIRQRCHQTCQWLRSTPLRDTFRHPYRTIVRWLHGKRLAIPQTIAP